MFRAHQRRQENNDSCTGLTAVVTWAFVAHVCVQSGRQLAMQSGRHDTHNHAAEGLAGDIIYHLYDQTSHGVNKTQNSGRTESNSSLRTHTHHMLSLCVITFVCITRHTFRVYSYTYTVVRVGTPAADLRTAAMFVLSTKILRHTQRQTAESSCWQFVASPPLPQDDSCVNLSKCSRRICMLQANRLMVSGNGGAVGCCGGFSHTDSAAVHCKTFALQPGPKHNLCLA
jgi:hypothetical protein